MISDQPNKTADENSKTFRDNKTCEVVVYEAFLNSNKGLTIRP